MVASTVGLCACGLLFFGLIVAPQSQPKDLDAVAEGMPDETVLRGATFLVGHRLYQIAITTLRERGCSFRRDRILSGSGKQLP
jgi:hypothetical protein